jgi:hypothetical protein
MFSIFKLPYPYDKSARKQIQEATFLGVIVALILLIFQPFGLAKISKNKEIIIIGYAFSGWIASIIVSLGMPYILPQHHKESNWTIGKAFLKNLHQIFWIGVACFIYSYLLNYTPWSWRALYYFEIYAFLIAPIPTFLIVLLKQKRLDRLYTKAASQLNRQLLIKNHNLAHNSYLFDYQGFNVELNDLLFVEISRQQANFYQEKAEKLEKTKLEQPHLKNLDKELQKHNFMFKAHPNYWVNLQKVKLITGNSRGFQLIFDHISESIPVASSQIQNLREKLR